MKMDKINLFWVDEVEELALIRKDGVKILTWCQGSYSSRFAEVARLHYVSTYSINILTERLRVIHTWRLEGSDIIPIKTYGQEAKSFITLCATEQVGKNQTILFCEAKYGNPNQQWEDILFVSAHR
jgi:hypothetical protein